MTDPYVLMTVAGIDLVWSDRDGRLTFLAGAMIDGDGSGGNPSGDPDFQPDTSLHFGGKALNASVDRFIVLPPEVICAVKGVVLGCHVSLTNAVNGKSTVAVVGDVGPSGKLGEISIACAEALGIDSNPRTGGESRRIVRYAIWPGQAAAVGSRKYQLRPYAAA